MFAMKMYNHKKLCWILYKRKTWNFWGLFLISFMHKQCAIKYDFSTSFFTKISIHIQSGFYEEEKQKKKETKKRYLSNVYREQ